MLVTRIVDKVGALGTLVAGMGCSLCFPALATLGAALGLGFLTAWERLFITTLIPLFAVVALLGNAFKWYRYRQWTRGLPGVLGSLLVLAGVAPLIFGLGQYVAYKDVLFYPGVALVLGAAIWDLVRPPRRECAAPLASDRANA